jgi:cell division protein FtsI (penicillin-binding protein 3)
VAAAEAQALRFRRRWLVLPAIVLPLLAALLGFAMKRPAVSPMSAPLAEQAPRGNIVALDGTILAEGFSSDRYYPQGSLAASIVGFTGAIQPDGRYGLEGLEYRLDGALQAGADVHLTLDPVLQSAAERHLYDSATTHGAESGAAVVLEVGTGRILAAASYPSYDPNSWQQAEREQMLNRAFQQVYEPGSVIKPLVVAGLLQDGLLNPHELIEAPMTLRVGLKTFRDVAWHEPLLSVPDVLAYSSNSGMIHLGQRFQPAQLHDWLWRFGLGHELDLDSAYTRSGILNPWDGWVPQDQAANSLGQNLSLTPLQLAAAYSIFANDGVYVPPVLVEGEEVPAPHRVLSAEVARSVRGMMVHVMENSGLRNSIVPGVSVAGKTGTADVYDPVTGTYPPDDYALTFAGIFPAEQPRVVVVVTLMKPEADSTSTYVAAPMFRAIGTEVVAHWGQADPLLPTAASR